MALKEHLRAQCRGSLWEMGKEDMGVVLPSSPPPAKRMEERSSEEEAREREKWASAPVQPGESGLVRAAMDSKFNPPPSSQASLKVEEAEDTWCSTAASVRVRRRIRRASVGEMD